MLTLQEQQRALRDLLRGLPVDLRDDPWLSIVAESRGLSLVKETADWRRRLQLESRCRSTTRLMKRLGCFDSWMEVLFAQQNPPPGTEELTTQLLVSLRIHENPILRSVAAFELACLASAAGGRSTAVVFWDRNPDAILQALDRHQPLPPLEPGVVYVQRIGPAGIDCSRRQRAAAQDAGLTAPAPAESQSYAARSLQPPASALPAAPSAANHIHAHPSRRRAAPPLRRRASAP